MNNWQATMLVIAAMFVAISCNIFAVGLIIREVREWRKEFKK